MILATHAIVGAAIASQIPNHPVIALLAGIASHFAIDAIPHWDYPLRSIRSIANKGSPLTLDKGFLVDLSLIALDGLAGLALAFSLFAQPSSLLTILLGALGGMLPDPLRFVHRLYPHEPLRAVQRCETVTLETLQTSGFPDELIKRGYPLREIEGGQRILHTTYHKPMKIAANGTLELRRRARQNRHR